MNTLKDKLEAIANNQTLKAPAKAILFSLATFDMYDYKVALSQKDLMEYSGIGSRNTISKTVKELENLGWLEVTKTKTDCGHFGNSVYQVLVPLENNAK